MVKLVATQVLGTCGEIRGDSIPSTGTTSKASIRADRRYCINSHMTPIPYSYISGEPYSDFNHDWIYQLAEQYLESIKLESSPNSWNWVRNNFCPIDIVLRNLTDELTGEEVKYSIDHSEKVLIEQRGFNNPIAFDAIRKHTSSVARTLLIYSGKGKHGKPINLGPGQVQAHTHTPMRNPDGSYKGPRMTATVVIPINIVEPVTETVCFAWQNIPYEKMDMMKDVMGWENTLRLSEEYNDRSNVQRIKFPEKGEYLTFYFDSSHYLHWSELETNNEFLCLVQDC